MTEKVNEESIRFLRKEISRLERAVEAEKAVTEEWRRIALMATISNGRVVSPVAIVMTLPDGGDRVGKIYHLQRDYIPERNEVCLRAQLKTGGM